VANAGGVVSIVSFEIVSWGDHKELSARGLTLTEIQEAPWGRFAMFNDPDGNGWILRQPPA
jgi:hypothetical protein